LGEVDDAATVRLVQERHPLTAGWTSLLPQKCGTTTENGEVVTTPEKMGFSPVWGPVSCCSSGDSGPRIGVNQGAPLYCRLRLDRQRAAEGADSSGRVESAENPGVGGEGWGFAVV
jgi:hypothetical protein